MASIRLDVEAYRQATRYSCLPCCIRMVLGYRGVDLSEEAIGALCETRSIGTSPLVAARALEAAGYEVRHFHDLAFARLAGYLRYGLPVIAFLRLECLIGVVPDGTR
jgi:hypothetical protein